MLLNVPRVQVHYLAWMTVNQKISFRKTMFDLNAEYHG